MVAHYQHLKAKKNKFDWGAFLVSMSVENTICPPHINGKKQGECCDDESSMLESICWYYLDHWPFLLQVFYRDISDITQENDEYKGSPSRMHNYILFGNE